MKRSNAKKDRIELRLVFSRRQLKAGIAGGLILLFCGLVSSETLTMVASFPSPIGIYNKLVATGQTILARDGGQVGINTATPGATLDVAGTANVSSTLALGGALSLANVTADPTSGASGQLVYRSDLKQIRGFNNGGWTQVSADPVPFIKAVSTPNPTAAVQADCPKGAATGGACYVYDTDAASGDRHTGGGYPAYALNNWQATGWVCTLPPDPPAHYSLTAYAFCTAPDGVIPGPRIFLARPIFNPTSTMLAP